ncbi:FecR family protein [Sphingobacterium sp. HJSM2_6]|uniref:FecR family protein n=1 Tax=Sphingobacterium sp. HJSM2_6 TaxID=3366264 RepID=UPI003BC2D03C
MHEERFFELLHQFLSKNLSIEDQKELETMTKVNPKYRKIFEEIAQPKQQEIVNARIDAQIDAVFSKKAVDTAILPVRSKKSDFIKRILPYAAVLLLGLFMLPVIWKKMSNVELNEALVHCVETKKGERKNITLPDGSSIWLNNASSITYNNGFGKENRDLMLVGEAYFDVASNKELPMLITANELLIKVVGTSFNVRSYPDEEIAETYLVEGNIQLYIQKDQPHAQFLQLKPGEKIKIDQHVKPLDALQPSNNTASNKALTVSRSMIVLNPLKTSATEIAWKENIMAFDSEPFEVVASKLEKWYDVQITITNEDLKKMEISGKFKESQIEEALEVIKLTGIDFNYKRVNNQIDIY